MCLQPGSAGRELLAVVHGRGGVLTDLGEPGPVLCVLPPPSNTDMLTIGMSRLALAIARETQPRGGVLLHGALASKGVTATAPAACGVILAGPSTVGKTTASSRLPMPWRSLSDDATLVVPDAQGCYWAHPWPTWSRFYSYADDHLPGGSWDVQQAVSLRALFFLSQAPEDRVTPIPASRALALLVESVAQIARPMSHGLDGAEERAIQREWVAAADRLARVIPAYVLRISLDGAFWKEIESVIGDTPVDLGGSHVAPTSEVAHLLRRASHSMLSVESLLDDGMLHVVYTGPSMNPTLRQPDLLIVVPYADRPVRPGDVIYCRSPEDGREVVHRVVCVVPDGIRTRGDNNPIDDPYLLQVADVAGRVVAARRGGLRNVSSIFGQL
jgi:signal peptidase I